MGFLKHLFSVVADFFDFEMKISRFTLFIIKRQLA